MIRNLMIVSALALSAPALAQQQPPADSTTTTTTTTAPTADQGMPGTTEPAQATPAASSPDVASVVQAEFSTYDADKSGDLNEAEFSKWVIALKTQAEGDKAQPAELDKWAHTAFAQADADKSQSVTQSELTTFLKG